MNTTAGRAAVVGHARTEEGWTALRSSTMVDPYVVTSAELLLVSCNANTKKSSRRSSGPHRRAARVRLPDGLLALSAGSSSSDACRVALDRRPLPSKGVPVERRRVPVAGYPAGGHDRRVLEARAANRRNLRAAPTLEDHCLSCEGDGPPAHVCSVFRTRWTFDGPSCISSRKRLTTRVTQHDAASCWTERPCAEAHGRASATFAATRFTLSAPRPRGPCRLRRSAGRATPRTRRRTRAASRSQTRTRGCPPSCPRTRSRIDPRSRR